MSTITAIACGFLAVFLSLFWELYLHSPMVAVTGAWDPRDERGKAAYARIRTPYLIAILLFSMTGALGYFARLLPQIPLSAFGGCIIMATGALFVAFRRIARYRR